MPAKIVKLSERQKEIRRELRRAHHDAETYPQDMENLRAEAFIEAVVRRLPAYESVESLRKFSERMIAEEETRMYKALGGAK